MTTLRQILILLILVLAHPYGKSQTPHDAKDIAGIWSMPFSYKHEGGIYHGRFFLELAPGNRLRLIETVKIGDRPDAFFARYDGAWSYDGSSLRISGLDDAKPMFAREIRNELMAAGIASSFVDVLERAFASSLPSADKLGLSEKMTIRDLSSKKLVLASNTADKALALQREAALPEVGQFKFSRSVAMEAKLSGTWTLNDGQNTMTLNSETHRLKGVLTFNDAPGLKAEYNMLWQASNGSIQLKFDNPTIRLTRHGEEVSGPTDVIEELILALKRQAAMSQVFGIAVELSGNRLNMTDLDGGCLVWNRVATAGASSRMTSKESRQASNKASKAAQPKASTVANSESDNVKKVGAESTLESSIDEKVYTAVEQGPQFPGGDAALLKWVSEHICYPAKAKENNIQGRVMLQFVVTKTGEVGEVKVLRSKDPDLDKEAIRVVKSITGFVPGKMNGHAVNVWYNLPVNFKIENPNADSI